MQQSKLVPEEIDLLLVALESGLQLLVVLLEALDLARQFLAADARVDGCRFARLLPESWRLQPVARRPNFENWVRSFRRLFRSLMRTHGGRELSQLGRRSLLGPTQSRVGFACDSAAGSFELRRGHPAHQVTLERAGVVGAEFTDEVVVLRDDIFSGLI